MARVWSAEMLGHHRVGGLNPADSAGCTRIAVVASSAGAGLMTVVGWRTYPGGRDTSGPCGAVLRAMSRYRARHFVGQRIALWGFAHRRTHRTGDRGRCRHRPAGVLTVAGAAVGAAAASASSGPAVPGGRVRQAGWSRPARSCAAGASSTSALHQQSSPSSFGDGRHQEHPDDGRIEQQRDQQSERWYFIITRSEKTKALATTAKAPAPRR